MKFDFAIGNPPYQEEQMSQDIDSSLKNYAPPVYHLFLDSAYKVADNVEMIHPARFLFNAGSTPKKWNEKMLEDEYFKVLEYEKDSSRIFANTVIKGGLAITYHNKLKKFGAIHTYSQFAEANSILRRVLRSDGYTSIDSIVFSRTSFRLTGAVHSDYPMAKNSLSEGHMYDMSSNIFQRLPFLFKNENEIKQGDVRVIGRENNIRVYKYIERKYINNGKNLDNYKVFIPQASGTGEFGEQLGAMVIGEIGDAATETFLSVGAYGTKQEAENTQIYLKTKFARCLISLLKVTQIGNKPVYKYVPLQDFTSSSDIDWSKSIPEIDQQLYRKYGLTEEEIEFIETHVKPME